MAGASPSRELLYYVRYLNHKSETLVRRQPERPRRRANRPHGIPSRTGRFSAIAKEILARADHDYPVAIRRPHRAVAGLGGGALHLYVVLSCAYPRSVG